MTYLHHYPMDSKATHCPFRQTYNTREKIVLLMSAGILCYMYTITSKNVVWGIHLLKSCNALHKQKALCINDFNKKNSWCSEKVI